MEISLKSFKASVMNDMNKNTTTTKNFIWFGETLQHQEMHGILSNYNIQIFFGDLKMQYLDGETWKQH